jgi:hypothetical protein
MQGRVSAVLEKNRRRWEEYSIAKNWFPHIISPSKYIISSNRGPEWLLLRVVLLLKQCIGISPKALELTKALPSIFPIEMKEAYSPFSAGALMGEKWWLVAELAACLSRGCCDETIACLNHWIWAPMRHFGINDVEKSLRCCDLGFNEQTECHRNQVTLQVFA